MDLARTVNRAGRHGYLPGRRGLINGLGAPSPGAVSPGMHQLIPIPSSLAPGDMDRFPVGPDRDIGTPESRADAPGHLHLSGHGVVDDAPVIHKSPGRP